MKQWTPHKPEHWPFHYMTTKVPITLYKWNKQHPVDENTKAVPLLTGTRVKIVMASRLGDVGITDDLEAINGYHLRVDIDKLESMFTDFGETP